MADPTIIPHVPDIGTIIATIWATIASCAAAYERLRTQKKNQKVEIDQQSVSDSKMWQARGDTMAKMAQEYKEYFEKERLEHAKTREYWHEKASSFQADMSKCQEQIIELKSRPDLTDILRGIERILTIIEKEHKEKHEH